MPLWQKFVGYIGLALIGAATYTIRFLFRRRSIRRMIEAVEDDIDNRRP
jgi:hypothetical protein